MIVHSKIGAELMESNSITLNNVSIYPEEGPVLTMENVQNVSIKGLETDNSIQEVFKIGGNRTEGILISSEYNQNHLVVGSNLPENSVKFE